MAEEDKKKKERVEKFSPTAAITYEECPLHYKFSYIDHIRKHVHGSGASSFGLMMHNIMAHVQPKDLHSLAENLVHFKASYRMLPHEYMGIASKISKRMFDFLWHFSQLGTMYREIEFKYKFEKNSVMDGKFDILIMTPEGKAIIIDWKLYKEIKNLTDENIKTQFANYAMLLWKGECRKEPHLSHISPDNLEIIIFYPFQNKEKRIHYTHDEINAYEMEIRTIWDATRLLSTGDPASYSEASRKAKEFRFFKDEPDGYKVDGKGHKYLDSGKPCYYCCYKNLECYRLLLGMPPDTNAWKARCGMKNDMKAPPVPKVKKSS